MHIDTDVIEVARVRVKQLSSALESAFQPNNDLTTVHVVLPASLPTPFRYSFPRTVIADVIVASVTGSMGMFGG
jgi:hypothetical protein